VVLVVAPIEQAEGVAVMDHTIVAPVLRVAGEMVPVRELEEQDK